MYSGPMLGSDLGNFPKYIYNYTKHHSLTDATRDVNRGESVRGMGTALKSRKFREKSRKPHAGFLLGRFDPPQPRPLITYVTIPDFMFDEVLFCRNKPYWAKHSSICDICQL